MKRGTLLLLCLLLVALVSANKKTYIVKEGDTLSEICFKLMENSMKETWEREAVRLNIEDPNLIYPGQVLHFPPVYRVSWNSKIADFSSHGSWNLSKNTILSWVKFGNENYPNIKHYIETK